MVTRLEQESIIKGVKKPTTPKAVSVPLSKGDYSTPPIPSEGVGVPTLNIIQAKGDYSTPPIPSEGVGVPTLNIIQARGGGGGSVILGPPPGWKPISEGSKFIQGQGKNLFKREQPSVIPVPQDRLSKPPKHPARMNFFEWKWRNSNAHFENSGHRKDILHGVTNDVEAVLLKINRDIETLRNEIGYMEAANFPEELLGEGVELTNSMLNMGANAAPYAFATAIGWATATLVGGFAIPAPEEIVTFPGALVAGLTTGMAFGVIKTSIDFEGSQVLIDMLVDGIPLKTARPLAYAAGVAIGLVELLQVGMFFGPVRMLFLKIIKGKAGQAVLRNILTKYFAQVGVQTGQEVIQEIIQLATQMVAGVYEGNEKAVPSSDEWVDRLFKVGYKSLLGFSLLGLPNLGGSAVTLSKEQMIKKMAKTIAEDEAAEVEGEAAVSDEEKYGDPALQKGKEGETVKEGSKEVSESKQTTDKKPAEQKQSEKDVSKGGTTISGVVTFSDKTKKIVTEFINADEGNVAFNIFNWGDRVFVEIIKHFNTLSDTRIELTNEEKKEYRQIESDLKRGDITVAESVVKHEELCKKAYTRALAESGKEKTQDTESDKVEPRVEVEKSFKELSEESEKLENRIEDTRDEIEKNQGITDLTKQEEVSEPLRQLESNRLKVDTALAQKAFDGAKKILHDLLGVTDEQFFDNSASIKGILNEYGLTDKPIGGAYFFNTRLISALNKVPSDEVVKKFTAILFKKEFPNADFLATFDSPIAGISKEAKLSFLEKGKKVAIGFQEKMKQLLLDKTESETVIEKSIPKLKSKVSQILTDGGEEMAEKAFDAIEHINPDPKAQERIINGRIKQIDAEIKALGEKLDLLEERLGDNKRKESLFNKIDKLTDEKILLKELQSDLKEAAAVAEIGNKPIKVAAKTLAALEKQNLKKQEQALNRGFREGQKLAKTDLKAAKKLIRDKINATGLDKDFKNALMNQVSFENITTPEQFFKSLEKIQEKINKAFNRQLRKNLTDVFAKVKKAKSLNKTFVDAIKDLYTKTLNGRTPSELSNSELGVLLNQINALISEGVLERSEFQEQQKQKNEELDNIAGEAADNISTVEEQNKIDETSLKQKLISAGKLVSSLKIYMIEN
ncbi:MAG: hypothetical protein GY928_04910, partial [Colwellia sp.]|nr:hypothetical protein [Colwellia sp.]